MADRRGLPAAPQVDRGQLHPHDQQKERHEGIADELQRIEEGGGDGDGQRLDQDPGDHGIEAGHRPGPLHGRLWKSARPRAARYTPRLCMTICAVMA
ncbi:MAG: hypothetical protein MZV64_33695 [Ignavibacteriales bacterium]|nr:hypothetical protein [Ignavibacteriales bacterium]